MELEEAHLILDGNPVEGGHDGKRFIQYGDEEEGWAQTQVG